LHSHENLYFPSKLYDVSCRNKENLSPKLNPNKKIRILSPDPRKETHLANSRAILNLPEIDFNTLPALQTPNCGQQRGTGHGEYSLDNGWSSGN